MLTSEADDCFERFPLLIQLRDKFPGPKISFYNIIEVGIGHKIFFMVLTAVLDKKTNVEIANLVVQEELHGLKHDLLLVK